jgi:hypothetical protein
MVFLWNQQWYCRNCLDRVQPGLADYAATHDRLKEEEPLWRRTYFRQTSLLLGAGSLLLFGRLAFLMARDPKFGVRPALEAVFVTLPILAITSWLLCAIIPYMVWRRWCRQTVCVRNGWIEVRSRVRLLRFPLSDCRWRLGKVRSPRMLSPWVEPSITLDFPGHFRGVTVGGPIAGCGYSPETAAIWKGLLTVARIPEPRTWGECRNEIKLAVFAISFAFVVGVSLGMLIGSMVATSTAIAQLRLPTAAGFTALACLAAFHITYQDFFWKGRSRPLTYLLLFGWFAGIGCLPGAWLAVQDPRVLKQRPTVFYLFFLFFGLVGIAIAWLVTRRWPEGEEASEP